MVDGAVVVHHLRHVGVHGCLHHKNDGCHNMSNTIQYLSFSHKCPAIHLKLRQNVCRKSNSLKEFK